MDKLIKIVLVILLFSCLADMPYGYYQLVRFIALAGFSVLAYKEYQRKNDTGMFFYIGLAVLFQPLFKISLGRTIWNIVDVMVGVWLIISLFKPNIQLNRDEK